MGRTTSVHLPEFSLQRAFSSGCLHFHSVLLVIVNGSQWVVLLRFILRSIHCSVHPNLLIIIYTRQWVVLLGFVLCSFRCGVHLSFSSSSMEVNGSYCFASSSGVFIVAYTPTFSSSSILVSGSYCLVSGIVSAVVRLDQFFFRSNMSDPR